MIALVKPLVRNANVSTLESFYDDKYQKNECHKTFKSLGLA